MKNKLTLGEIINNKQDVKRLVNQDRNVHWQLNIVLAVFIRDSLKIFLKRTPALPKTSNKLLDNLLIEVRVGKITEKEYKKQYNKTIDREDNAWREKIQGIISSFDRYIHMWDDLYEKQCVPEGQSDEFFLKMVDCGNTSFDLLKEVFDDLEW